MVMSDHHCLWTNILAGIASKNLNNPEKGIQYILPFAGVAIKAYKVIYELIDDVRALMEGRLSAVEERQTLGEAEVRAVFGSGSRRVAGCMVTEGLLRKGCLAVVRLCKCFTLHFGVKMRLGDVVLCSS